MEPEFEFMKKKPKRRETQISADGVLSNLPMDVSFDILSRLPLKTISKCRWVCKTWYDLILHPRFAEIHYAKTLQDSSSPCVVFRDAHKYFHLIDNEDVDILETLPNVHSLKLRQRSERFKLGPFVCNDVLGSVNGLVCFHSSSSFCICNPVTGDYVILPESPRGQAIPLASGFGFDSSNDKYKVVQILTESTKFKAKIFTLGSESWRVIQNVPNMTPAYCSNVFVNGNLHWVSRADNDLKVVSFNVRTEEFNVIQLPACFKRGGSDKVKGLVVLGEHLCVLDDDKVIWMMGDYGVSESWAIKYVLEHVDRYWYGGHTIIELKNGELVLLDWRKRICYYDPENNTSRPITINNLNAGLLENIRHPIIQVGSLISPRNVSDQ